MTQMVLGNINQIFKDQLLPLLLLYWVVPGNISALRTTAGSLGLPGTLKFLKTTIFPLGIQCSLNSCYLVMQLLQKKLQYCETHGVKLSNSTAF